MSRSARDVALQCLREVMGQDAYANLVMPGLLRQARLSGPDAGFAVELAYGSLRMSGWYDHVIAAAAKRSITSLDPLVRWILWLGAHQHLTLGLPPHAAVNETVTLSARHAARAKGLVNAVMRRITERTAAQWQQQLAAGNSLPALACRHSHPEWTARALHQALEREGRGEELEDLLQAHNAPAGVTLVARPGAISRDDLLTQVPGGVATDLSPWGVTNAQGDPGAIGAVRDGTAGVQDEGSQLAAAVLARHGAVATGERWWDACAGPGGKAALLSALAHHSGARVLATDLHPHRVDLIRSGLRGLPLSHVEVRQADATSDPAGPFERILLDAPCSGLGALRRRPESRWRRTPEDVDGLTGLQARLVSHALSQLAPGGLLVYVTCSPVVAETTDIIAGAQGVVLEDVRPTLESITGVPASEWGDHPWVQLWPHRHRTDAMFIAALRAPGTATQRSPAAG